MKPRLGLLVRADKTGLGYQTKDYYKWLKPHKTILIDISELNQQPQYYGWYDDKFIIKGIPTPLHIKNMLKGIDVLLTAETFYNLDIIRVAKDMGVKTICVENPEFYDHKKYPQYNLPDMMILPSKWLETEIREHAEPKGVKVVQLHHPVDRDVFKYRERTTNKTYHIAGKPATLDRNGTWDYLRAEPGGKVITQDTTFANHLRGRFSQCNVFTDIQDNAFMYHLGDIMVLPRKYGGNCLPLNEALSSGSPVLMPDITPNQTLLPREWRMPAVYDGSFAPRGDKIDVYKVERFALQERIAYIKSQDPRKISRMANDIAETISWSTLLPKWQEAIEGVFSG